MTNTASTSSHAAKIRTISEDLVTCQDSSRLTKQPQPWLLGPFEYTMTPLIPTSIIYLYEKSDGAASEVVPVARLKKATEILLDYYPHLTGRFDVEQRDRTPQVSHLGQGALFCVAECSATLESFKPSERELLISDLPNEGNALLPPVAFSPDEAYKNMLFAIKHTRFACGSVAVSVTVLHVITDAAGYFRLVEDLAQIYRHLTSPGADVSLLHNPPAITSYLDDFSAEATEEERQQAVAYEPRYHALAGELQAAEATSAAAERVTVTGKVFRFSRPALEALKQEATSVSNGITPDSWTSTFDALSAAMYQSIFEARANLLKSLGREAEIQDLSTNFLTSVDVRARMGLPERYFANAVSIPFFSWSSPDELQRATLSETAKAVHDLSRAESISDLEATLRWIACQRDKSQIIHKFGFEKPACALSAWNKFDTYSSTALDGVRPCIVAAPFHFINKVNGLVYFLQAAHGNDGLDVYVALDERLWPFFQQAEWVCRAQCLTDKDNLRS
ncbi:unnamed protein product [Sympodiomycopsis kandeliae]